MDRVQIITAGIEPQMLGIEVGPWFAPLVPKRQGYNVLSLDVYSREKLLEHARTDPSITPAQYDLVEEVDLVGGATSIEQLVEEKGLLGQVDYIVSSHNFEHLPNPVRFLQGCERVLKPSGFLSMAIPDRRSCFDFFRPVSTTGSFMEAAHRDLDHPSPASTFDYESLHAKQFVAGHPVNTWEPDEDGAGVQPVSSVEGGHQRFKDAINRAPGAYFDCHSSVFTRSSFELIIRDLHFIGVTQLGIERMEGPKHHEFYARLSKRIPVPEPAAFRAQRAELLQQIVDEMASNSRLTSALRRKLDETEKALAEKSGEGRSTGLFRRLDGLFRRKAA